MCSLSIPGMYYILIGDKNYIHALFNPISGDFSPVVSLAGVQEPEKNDILLVAKLNSVWAFECNPGC